MPYIGRSLGDGVRARYIYAATSGQTTFSGNDANGIALAYSDTLYMDVYQNGVLLKPVTDYASTTGTSVVLVTGASTDDVVEMIVYDSFAVADTVSAINGGAFTGNISSPIVSGTTSIQTPLIEASNGTDALSINSSGFVSQSKIVAFHAKQVSAIAYNNYVIFSSIDTNEGSGYNSTDGKFTVPTGGDGTYFFHSRLVYDKDSTALDTHYNAFTFHKNDSQIGGSNLSHYYGRGDYDYNDATIITTLVAGDTIRIYNGGNATLYVGNYSTFNGFRIG